MISLTTLFNRIRGVTSGVILGRVTTGVGRAELLTPEQIRTLISVYSIDEVDIAISEALTAIDDTYVPFTGAASSIDLNTQSLIVGAVTSSGKLSSSYAGAVSQSVIRTSGLLFTGGDGTTNFPQFLQQPSDATPATDWPTSGVFHAVNASAGFGGRFLDFRVDGATPVFYVSSAGTLAASSITSAGGISANGGFSSNYAAAVGQSALLLTGALLTGGTGTNTLPKFLQQPTGATAVTTWSTAGTLNGNNAASGFAGNFYDCHVNGGASVFKVDYLGNITGNSVTINGNGAISGTTGTTANRVVTATGTNNVVQVSPATFDASGNLGSAGTGSFSGLITASAGATITGGGVTGTDGIKIGSFGSGYGGIWPGSVTPTATNYLIVAASNSNTFVNAITGKAVSLAVNNLSVVDVSFGLMSLTGSAAIAPQSSTGSPTRSLTITTAAHTALTTATEHTSVFINGAATQQFATGAITTQRFMRIAAPTYSFAGASTITTASTLSISGPPIAGTNATITDSYAVRVESGNTFLNGRLAIGVDGLGGSKLNVYGSSSSAIALIQSASTANGAIVVGVVHGGPTTGSVYLNYASGSCTDKLYNTCYQLGSGAAVMQSVTNGAGDAQSSYEKNGGQAWSAGLDQSAFNSYKISASQNLGTSDVLTITTAGAATFANTLTASGLITASAGIAATPRIQTFTNSASPAPDFGAYDQVQCTVNATTTFGAVVGTFTGSEERTIRITDDGTSRTIAWNAIYRSSIGVLPTATVASTPMYAKFRYNATATKWDCVESGGGLTVNGVVNAGGTLVVGGTSTLTGKATFGAIVHTPQTYTPSAAGTATLDCSLGNVHRITMPAGNITIALSSITDGQTIRIAITQDGVGSRTVTWFNTIRWAGGVAPTLTTTASKRDVIVIECTGSGTYDGFVAGASI